MNTKPTEEVPAYEELYEQTPQNKRTGVCHPETPDQAHWQRPQTRGIQAGTQTYCY
jgi:hypothetical protein